MEKDQLTRKLAVILHADVVGSTSLVQLDETLAHERIQSAFNRFSETISDYGGFTREVRGDALVAEFDRASDAVASALSFQAEHAYLISRLEDDLRPTIRVGIAMGEVVIADDTVTGSGVVLAQRVEQLANPGGLCITAALHEALPKRMPFDLKNLGEQVLKGFDDPVRVYRVELSEGQSVPAPEQNNQRDETSKKSNWLVATIVIALIAVGGGYYWYKAQVPQEDPASAEHMAYPLPDKPSIAVLPFSNLSDDKQQEYFADGMTEDLITDISKISGLFVIARNSVFTYKGKAVKVRRVAKDLGVRYVMEGSVRRVGNQVRVNAQLIDATTGGHIWAERYDGSLDDVFSMQDKITRSIVVALSGTLVGLEQGLSDAAETSSPEAYDAFLRGWERYRQGTPDDLAKATTYFMRAIELDSDYARAHSALAAAYLTITLNGWSRSLDLLPFEVKELSRLALKKAMKKPSALTYQVASERAAYLKRKPDEALANAAHAIDLDANDPAGHLAMATALIKADRAGEAVESVRTAMRLDPHYPAFYLNRLGQAQFAIGQYEEALASFEEAAQRNPEDEWVFVYLAATNGQLGYTEAAARAVKVANTLRAKSGWGPLTVQIVDHHFILGGRRYYFKWFGDYKHLRDALRKAGVKTEVAWRHLIVTGESGTEIKGAKTIDVDTAKTLHERGIPFIDVDIKWLQKRIPGAHFLSWWNFHFNEALLLKIAGKNQEVVIYSSDERWAPLAVARAVSWGYENVYFFPYGIDKWKTAGYPVDTSR